MLKNDASINEARDLIPAGSNLISGNKVKKEFNNGVTTEEVEEYRASFKSMNGDKYTIVENI